MNHEIKYQSVGASWFEALPLGNGKFGSMMYFENGELTIVFNHYDVYYEEIAKVKNFDVTSTYQQDRVKFNDCSFAELTADSYHHALHPVEDKKSPLYHMKNTPKTHQKLVPYG